MTKAATPFSRLEYRLQVSPQSETIHSQTVGRRASGVDTITHDVAEAGSVSASQWLRREYAEKSVKLWFTRRDRVRFDCAPISKASSLLCWLFWQKLTFVAREHHLRADTVVWKTDENYSSSRYFHGSFQHFHESCHCLKGSCYEFPWKWATKGSVNGAPTVGDKRFRGSTRISLEIGDECRRRTLHNPWKLLVLSWMLTWKRLSPKKQWNMHIPRKLPQLRWERPCAFVEVEKTSVEAVEASAKAAEVSREALSSFHYETNNAEERASPAHPLRTFLGFGV